jgi:hypothetical protein
MGLFSSGSYPSPEGGTGICAAGGTVTCSGGYKIHTFTSSGTFQVFKGGTGFQYLVIGGGGGGGKGHQNSSIAGGGGGGAGGWRCCGNVCVPACGHIVTIGLGGNTDESGQSSCFYNLISAGGGAGGQITIGGRGLCGNPGGNGGGAGGANCFATPNNGAGNTPATTPSQGFAGGCAINSNASGSQAGGGGGGAGATGQSGFCLPGGFSAGGFGGDGKSSCISGTTTWYSGGGGGAGEISSQGCGGCGGGGRGAASPGNGDAGTPNTGGGGGGAVGPNAACFYGGCGGSGIVIIRYPY